MGMPVFTKQLCILIVYTHTTEYSEGEINYMAQISRRHTLSKRGLPPNKLYKQHHRKCETLLRHLQHLAFF
jgi:hypothetical protein